jgi:hypothetical protein
MLGDNTIINQCRKCQENIGGKAYYLVKLDCIFDGEHISKCDTITLCSACYHSLMQWLQHK